MVKKSAVAVKRTGSRGVGEGSRPMLPRKKNVLEAPHSQIVHVYPEELTIPGKEYASMGLYQPFRNELPLDPAEIEEVMRPDGGIRQPVLAFRDGAERLVVIDGRQRVKLVGAANERFEELGGNVKLRVPVRVVRARDVEFVKSSIVANRHRRDEGAVTLANSMQYLLNNGEPIENVAKVAKLKPSQAKSYLKLLELCEEAQRLVENGEMTITVAVKLADKPRAEQKKELEAREKGAKDKPRIRSLERDVALKVLNELDKEHPTESAALHMGLLLLNEIEPEDAFPHVPGLEEIWERIFEKVDGVQERIAQERERRQRAMRKPSDAAAASDEDAAPEPSRAVG